MTSRFSAAARAAMDYSLQEAARRGDRRIGTDHLLLGILHDPDISALTGIDVETARSHAQNLDHRALAAIGIDVEAFNPVLSTRPNRHMPFSSGTRTVIPRALALATTEKSRQITTTHLLHALLEQHPPDPAAVLLADLQIESDTLHDGPKKR